MPSLSYDPEDPQSILRAAKRLVGLTLGEVQALMGSRVSDATTKGYVGAAYESYFGLPPNSSWEPDFRIAGVELKSVPLKRTSSGYQPKERTVIGLIDYEDLCPTEWEHSHLEAKTRKILFVFYEWVRGVPIQDFRTLAVHLWERSPFDEVILRDAYEHVRRRVCAGEAHLISEADTPGVGACTKDARARDYPQPFSDSFGARRRAFAFKASFTHEIWLDTKRRQEAEAIRGRTPSTVAEFEERILRRIRKHRGKMIGQLIDELEIDVSPARKDKTSIVARRMLGASTNRGRIEEFEKLGITIRTVRVNDALKPKEHVSFSPVDFLDVVDETWEDSTFREEISNILFVVFVDARRWHDQRLLGAFFWTPTPEELVTINDEWEEQLNIIREGSMDGLPRASETHAVHVRPHGKDSSHQVPLPGGGTWVKSSFWLNAGFVGELIRSHL